MPSSPGKIEVLNLSKLFELACKFTEISFNYYFGNLPNKYPYGFAQACLYESRKYEVSFGNICEARFLILSISLGARIRNMN